MKTNNLKSELKSLVDNLYPKMVDFRRHLHMNPELSFEEKETMAFISSALKEEGIFHETSIGGFGIVATLEGTGAGPCVLLRADMDALPIQEENDVSYKSQNPGVMHACGHDVHSSCLLGALIMLNRTKKLWNGSIVGVFQPAEEKTPGGAKAMLEAGLIQKYQPEIAIGQHVHPPLEAGKVAFIEGQSMASADEIYLTVKGRGGHAALVKDCIDPIPIAAQIVQALQQIVSRKADPFMPTVLSIGKIESTGGSFNVIPSEVKMAGTIRTFDESWRSEIHEYIEKICHGIAVSNGGACDVNILKGYPALYNDPEVTRRSRQAAVDLLGAENVVDMDPRMTAEDFSYFAREMPACFFRLGTGNREKGIVAPIHTPRFDIDEDALLTGSLLMAWIGANQ
ncbi:MAG: amidohydrolase [Saprospirales bacterium]|nr:MAG: amidohydrolase [Saprospirales bacterium]